MINSLTALLSTAYYGVAQEIDTKLDKFGALTPMTKEDAKAAISKKTDFPIAQVYQDNLSSQIMVVVKNDATTGPSVYTLDEFKALDNASDLVARLKKLGVKFSDENET